MIDHLTMTGRYAGQTYCGEPRIEGERYGHTPYITDIDAWALQHVSCKECRDILKGDDDEDE